MLMNSTMDLTLLTEGLGCTKAWQHCLAIHAMT